MSEAQKTAVIIGAGPAGLTAAYELLTKTDIRPVILEEADYIGGISRTVRYNGNRMDIGGHRFFSKNDEVMDFWRNLMPIQGAPSMDDALLGREKPLAPGGPDPEQTDRVMLVRTRVSRIFFRRKFFAYPISLSGETIRNMGVANTLKAGFGYVWSAIFKKKETNLKNFYINRFGAPLYKMFFEDYTEKVWGVNPDSISADWGAQRVKGLSLFKALWTMMKKPFTRSGDGKNVETSLIEQFIYPKKGPGQLWETLADEIVARGGVIVKNARVKTVLTENGRLSGVVAEEKDGERTYTGDYYLSSMPIKDLVAAFDGGVPQDVADIASALPLPRFHHRRPAGGQAAHSEQDEDENALEHRARLLDLCAGARRAHRPPPDFQQLVALYGRGPRAYGLDRVGILLQRGRRDVGDERRGVHRLCEKRA